MKVYAAFDLHSRSSHLAVLDEQGKKLLNKKLPNDAGKMVVALEPYRQRGQAIAVDSTFNWYWLVDALMEAGCSVHLANPAAIQKYKGQKHANDSSDALWLAEMLRLGILPEGYIYMREERPVRDLLRKRMHLVRLRPSLILSLQNIITRNTGVSLGGAKIKQLTDDLVAPLLEEDEQLAFTGQVSKQTIDFLTWQIKNVEKKVRGKITLKKEYACLNTIPGVGDILSLTIMLETDPTSPFSAAGTYACYCRKLPTRWTSNGKKKGKGNKNNGNKCQAWALSEAAELARRYDPSIRAWYNRKTSKTNRMLAHSALSHKLARAVFHILTDQAPFDTEKLIG